jgi:hypothetical protein
MRLETLMGKPLEELLAIRDRLVHRLAAMNAINDSGEVAIEKETLEGLSKYVQIVAIVCAVAAAADSSGETKH